MLTQEEYFITEDIKRLSNESPEVFNDLMKLLNEDAVPLLTFCKETIEDYPNLLEMLYRSEGKEEFIIHSYYYLLEQSEYYQATGLKRINSNELAQEDLKTLYSDYNHKDIVA